MTNPNAPAEGWADGKSHGVDEGQERAIAELTPYLAHIGNCGAMGSDPTDRRCICGLRQVVAAFL